MDTATRTMGSLVLLGHSLEQATEKQRAATFKDWDAFARSGVQPQGFYLHEGALWQEWLQKIRHSSWWNLPVFASPGLSPAAAYVDELCPPARAQEVTEAMALRRKGLADPDDVLGLEERVLYFLYERGPQGMLKPVMERHSAQLYHYPVATLLAQPHEDADQVLQDLRRRGLLRAEGLMDRTRHCSSCASAHIHFVDVCPHCQNLDIQQETTLHCFSCGNVAAESHFLEGGSLACPKCHVHLRHIGVDYDKPLAQYSCKGCERSFMEAMVQARCLDCGKSSSPSDLEVREVSRLVLSAAGRSAVRRGTVGESFAALQSHNYVEPQSFRRMLDWACAIQARHAASTFHLMRIEFVHAAQLQARVGAVQLHMLIDELAQRLNAQLRDSDVITRTEEHSLWVLLPHTLPQGLQERIEAHMRDLAQEDAHALALSLRIQTLDVADVVAQQEAYTAQSLMHRLQGA